MVFSRTTLLCIKERGRLVVTEIHSKKTEPYNSSHLILRPRHNLTKYYPKNASLCIKSTRLVDLEYLKTDTLSSI